MGDIDKLEKLKDSGELTAEEFLMIKNKLIENTQDAQCLGKESASDKVMNEKKDIEPNNRVCTKCNNIILEDEKFCGKCGTKVKKYTQSNKYVNNSETITIKFSHLIIGIVVIIFVICFCVTIYNSQSNIETDYTNLANTTNSESNKNETLEVIDQDKQEFKINIKTLAETIIKVNDEIEEQERTAYKTKLTYETERQTDPSTGKGVIVYTLSYEGLGTLTSYPIMLLANADTYNVYRICVYHPYLNSYGTEINTSAMKKNYNLLSQALIKLNQKELSDTIYALINYATDQVNSGNTSISADFNMKGVHIGGADGPINKYGNKAGVYFLYGTR